MCCQHIPSHALRLWKSGHPLSVCQRSQFNKSLIVNVNSEFIHLIKMFTFYHNPSIWRKITFNQVWNTYWSISFWKFNNRLFLMYRPTRISLSTCGFFVVLVIFFLGYSYGCFNIPICVTESPFLCDLAPLVPAASGKREQRAFYSHPIVQYLVTWPHLANENVF